MRDICASFSSNNPSLYSHRHRLEEGGPTRRQTPTQTSILSSSDPDTAQNRVRKWNVEFYHPLCLTTADPALSVKEKEFSSPLQNISFQ